jgi:hypothetical protein
MKTITEARADVTVKYLDGHTAIISNPAYPRLTDNLFRVLAAVAAKAGKVTLLSYVNIDAVVELDADEITERNGNKWMAINDKIDRADVAANY